MSGIDMFLTSIFIHIHYLSSVGGIRASLYNAITEAQVDKLIAYIQEFILKQS